MSNIAGRPVRDTAMISKINHRDIDIAAVALLNVLMDAVELYRTSTNASDSSRARIMIRDVKNMLHVIKVNSGLY